MIDFLNWLGGILWGLPLIVLMIVNRAVLYRPVRLLPAASRQRLLYRQQKFCRESNWNLCRSLIAWGSSISLMPRGI